jgi:uncharacterized damage-inducible protein DinB
MTAEEVIREVKTTCVEKIRENTDKVLRCLSDFSDTEIWERPSTASNSMGNLILHLCGNITQYILSALGGREDRRERDKEFGATGGYSKDQLLNQLVQTTKEATTIIMDLDPNEFLKVRSVQGFLLTGIGIVVHVTEHYSYHTGQIAFQTKQVRNKDLGFYAHINLNKNNEKELPLSD